MTDETQMKTDGERCGAQEAADAAKEPVQAPIVKASDAKASSAGAGGRMSGAMSPRVSGEPGGEVQVAAEQALGSGKRIDLLRYLRLRRREK